MPTILDFETISLDPATVEIVGLDADTLAWECTLLNTPDADAAWGEPDEDASPVAAFVAPVAPVAVSVAPEATPAVAVRERDAAACRIWARENGHTVGARGVIAESIWTAYLTAPVVVRERDAAACRTWARANGHTVGARGLIAESIWTAYLAS